jgi:hypothetical protein
VPADPTLESIDAKLAALVALAVDVHLRTYGTPRQQRPRSLDRILTDAGLSARDVGELLGKTERAVHLALQAERKKTKGPAKPDSA